MSSLNLAFDELLRYTTGEREKWRTWLSAHPEAMETPVQPGGRPLLRRKQAIEVRNGSPAHDRECATERVRAAIHQRRERRIDANCIRGRGELHQSAVDIEKQAVSPETSRVRRCRRRAAVPGIGQRVQVLYPLRSIRHRRGPTQRPGNEKWSSPG